MKFKSHRGITEVIFSREDSLDLGQFNCDCDNDIFIIDKNIESLFFSFCKIEKSQINNIFFINTSEESKDIKNVTNLIQEILLTNKTPNKIISFGGGIIQDISGFCSSLIRRGIEWIFIPTTLLSMADSCIGSKISINVNSSKNQIGLLYPPQLIIIIPNLLKSLPHREYLSGAGDILHYALQEERISDIYLDILPTLFNKFDELRLLKVIEKTLSIKKFFIEKDEFDKSIRKSLNLGHSFGHAIEKASNFKIPHGIAVIIGCSLAYNYSIEVKLIKRSLVYDHIELINKLLLASYKYWGDITIDFNELILGLKSDKKNKNPHNLNLILPVIKDNKFNIYPIEQKTELIIEFLRIYLNDKKEIFESQKLIL